MLRDHVVPSLFRKRVGVTRTVASQPVALGQIRLTWIGHAGFYVEFGARKVVIDPVDARWLGVVKRLREPGLRVQELPQVDLVLVSHAHHDHMHKRSLCALRSRWGTLVPAGSAGLLRRWGISKVQEMQWWEEQSFEEIHVLHTPAHHWGARFLHDTHRAYGGYVIESQGRVLYHCGDSAYFAGFREIGQRCAIDIALMPIGAYGAPSGRDVHMNPEQAMQAFIELGAKVMIPMHYATFPLGNEPADEPLTRLLSEAQRLGIADRVLVPVEGVPLML